MKKSFKSLLVAGSLIALNDATPANAWDYYPYYPYGGYYGYSYVYPDIGAAIANAFVTVTRADVGLAGPFEATLTFAPPAANTPAAVEVYTNSPRDGAETILDSVDVVLQP